MAKETREKRAFHEDIFAEDADKWSWPTKATAATTSSGANYTSEVKSDSSCSSDSANGFRFRDSDSPQKSIGKLGSSCDYQEDASSSSQKIEPRERLRPPSIYDDDAQSGSPSGVFEKKDLAFQSSFKKSFEAASDRSRSREKSPVNKEPNVLEKQSNRNSGLSPKRKTSSESRPLKSFEDVLPKKSRSRSKSREAHSRRHSRSSSRSRDQRVRSPRRDRRRSRSRDRRSDRERGSRHGRGRRSRSRDSRRHRGHYRSSSRDRYRRRRHSRSRSRSHSRERFKGYTSRKPGSLSLSTSGGTMTPQMALQQTMAAMSAKAQALTGIALPKYYNPAAVNPLKYAEQVQKRKLLWQSTEKKVEQEVPQPKTTVWNKLTFAQDQDGKMTAKFRKLMGIKSEENAQSEAEEKESVLKQQEELFRNLDQQYEMARMTTHTQRGVGLGYSAQPLYPPVSK
ncbi:hypothetical protein JTE90_019743 [Oedothorax gibbosus]|uniref:Small acidic protein-like domain-containing protein n=1 Tax=Oedothorax gibbosus TaxID=931172 RepID=A0AAV6UMR9_9ARAC|nr:hypothetical protein JTE90_019743 [Oedothorax gibbosus]